MPDRGPGSLLPLDLFEGLTAESLLLGARRWARLTISPLTITALAGLLTLIGTSLLLRALPIAEAGRLALLLALLETLSLFGGLGQPGMITRLYSQAKTEGFDWPRDLVATLGFSAIPLTLGSFAAIVPYSLPAIQSAFLALGSLGLGVLIAGCFMLNARGHYIWSSLLMRLPNALLVIPGLLAAISIGSARLPAVLETYGIGLIVTTAIMLALLGRLVPRGTARITRGQRIEGLVFLATSGVALLPDQGIVAIGGALLDPGQLATYAAIAVLMRPFKLAGQILASIMTPELIRRERPNYRAIILALWGVALSGALAAAVVGPPVASWVFAGRYDNGLPLLPLLGLAGALQLTVVLPKSDLSGQAPMSVVQKLVLGLVAAMGILTAFSLGLIRNYGILGLGIAAVTLQAGRNLVSYAFWVHYRRGMT